MTADIHTCSYQCQRPACVLAQRDDLVRRAEADAAEIVRLRGEAESMEQMARMQAARADAAEREVTHLRSIASAEAKGGGRDREADRTKFPDAGFNAWLDCGISDAGHTVYDAIGCVADAWQGWNAHVVAMMVDSDPDLFDTPQPAGGKAVAPFLWLRMRPDGTPDWAEDCVGQDEHFLDSELKRDGYWLKPLYDATPPAAWTSIRPRTSRRGAGVHGQLPSRRRPTVGKFRKKPVVIEATQWFKPGDHPAVVMKSDPNRYADAGVPWVETREGGHVVTPGDWIITGVKGEHYPCKPDAFAMTYEPAEEPSHDR